MPQATANKLYRTFLKGLVTEASALTYPEDTSFDEDNCLIFVAGNRTRRLGMDYEDEYQLSSYTSPQSNLTPALVEYTWKNVANIEGLDFLCHQVNDTIHFYNCSGNPVSPNIKSFSIDLSDYYVAGYVSPEYAQVQMVSGKGYLFVVSAAIQPIIVEYTLLSDSISVQEIEIVIRDFDGVDDGIAVDDEPNSLTAEHNYNLQNQGWVTDSIATVKSLTLFGVLHTGAITKTVPTNVIQKYKDVIGKYPGNNKQWFLGKVEVAADGYQVGDFNPKLLNKVHVGNSRAPRGHFLINAFNKDRTDVSGISGLTVSQEATRPTTLCFAAGRVFYGHKNNVYFSQILSEKHKAGLCFQDNDPTSEDISDLLDNDGGVIPISSADQIILTKEVSNGIMVFANNGVWFISGGDKGFAATDYQVTKVSTIGTDAPYAVVDTENHIYWWSKTGIQRIEQQSGMFGAVQGKFNSTNLTENTIDRLVKAVPSTIRKHAKGVFDHGTNTIHWMYSSSDVGVTNFYNKFLNFNIVTESFFPWSLNYSGNFPTLTGIYVTSDINRVTDLTPVTIDGDQVMIGIEDVVIEANTLTAKDSFVQYLCAVPDGTNYKFTVCNFNNDGYVDWETFDGDGVTYNSFVETGFEILDDAMRAKSIVWLQPYFRQTEENFVLDGTDYTVDKPSSCYLTTKWDWSNSSASNRWSTKVQAYRLTRVPFVNPADLTLNTGFKLVTTRNKIRGHGRAIQFRFECDEPGKNFDLLGWQVFYTGNTVA